MAKITDVAQIWRILKGIGWPIEVPEFDPPYDFADLHICQLIPETEDGFPEEVQTYSETGPDPTHSDDYIDPPHWED